MTQKPGAFFSPVPTDQVLALAAEGRIKRADAMLLLALLSHKRSPALTEVRPRQERLARLLACSVRTVQRGLDRLEAAGLIARRYVRDALGRLGGRRYDLAATLALLPARVAAGPSASSSASSAPSSAPSSASSKATVVTGGGDAPATAGSAPESSAEGASSPGSPKRHARHAESESESAEVDNSAPARLKTPAAPLSPAAEKLVGEGMLRGVAARLAADCGEARCRQALDALAGRRGIQNRAAWLYRCLSDGWELTSDPSSASPPARPRSHCLSRPPAAPPPPCGPAAPDPLDSLPPSLLAHLEEQARSLLIAELPVLRPVLEKKRRTPQVTRRMRALLTSAAGAGE